MKKILLIIIISLFFKNIAICYEVLPNKELMPANPYKTTFKDKLKSMPIGLKNTHPKDKLPSENYAISRMEREWFKKEFQNMDTETRVEHLEEKIFGAIQSGDITKRINNLKDAFDAQKQIQAKEHSYGYNIFSGLPTSVPMNVDELLGY